jgi:hypothetical protein
MMTFAPRRLVAATVGLALCLAVVGCGTTPGLTKANFDRIKTDGTMTKEDVDKLMGSQGTDLTGEAAKQFDAMLGQMAKGPGDMLKGMPDGGKAMQDAGKAFGEMANMAGKKMEDVLSALGSKFIRWGDDSKFVVCRIMNGKVIGKHDKGL